MLDRLSPARPREPVLNLPRPVTVLLVALLLIHAVRSWVLPTATDFAVLLDFSFVPARWAVWWEPSSAAAVMQSAKAGAGESSTLAEALARYAVEEEPGLRPWTAVTYALLHGSWLHVVLNSFWLAAFGTPVARRCGPLRFAVLATLSALGGAALHLAAFPFSAAPLIGASAAGAGLMGASIRFIFAPPQPWPTRDGVVLRQPALGFRQLLVDSRVLLFVGVWLATNFLFAVGAGPMGLTDANVAWQAHVGGFVTGLLLFPLFDPDPDRMGS
jgi:membrane associated rhomboid family serine protease